MSETLKKSYKKKCPKIKVSPAYGYISSLSPKEHALNEINVPFFQLTSLTLFPNEKCYHIICHVACCV